MASKKKRNPKSSHIEQDVFKEIEKLFGIKVYSSRQKLQMALKKFKK